MTLDECYAALEGDYADVLNRLHSERLVQKFVLKFINDGSYDLLCSSFETKNREEAFRAAHTLKGVCQNLSFTKLYQSSHNLTEALRIDWTPEAPDLFEEVKRDYTQTLTAIKTLAASVES